MVAQRIILVKWGFAVRLWSPARPRLLRAVRFHVTTLMAKLKVTYRLEAVLEGGRQGFIEMPTSSSPRTGDLSETTGRPRKKTGADDR